MKTKWTPMLMGALLLPAVASGTPAITLRVEPEQERVVRSDATEVVFRVQLRGADLEEKRSLPLNLAVVLDRSGSMRGAKLEKAKQAAGVVVDRLGGEDRFSLVTYDNEVRVPISARKVTDPRALKREIERIETGGSTALYAGVESGASQVREYLSRERVNRVILLSDGLANVGPKTPRDLADLGSRLREDGIAVTTVGLGEDYNEDLMVALAEASAANYYYVRDAETLPEIFAKELGHVRSIIARNVRIVIELPEGIEPVEVMGHPEVTFRHRKAELVPGELAGGQERHYLIRCRVTKPAGDRQELARAELVYLDRASERQSDSASAHVVFTDDPAAAARSKNDAVATARAGAENVEARQRALKLADEGNTAAAVSVLRSQSKAGADSSSPELKQEADQLERAAAALESEGAFDKPARKEFQLEIYKQKNQRD